MNEFWTKVLKIVLVVAMLFAILAGVTYAKVNSYDLGEVTMNGVQTLVAVLFGWLVAQFR